MNTLTLVTYNINGARMKLAEVGYMIQTAGIEILALQETLQCAGDWSLHIPGFQVHTAVGTRGPSQRGLALAVSKVVSSQCVGTSSPHWLSIQVFGTRLATPTIFLCTYVPG